MTPKQSAICIVAAFTSMVMLAPVATAAPKGAMPKACKAEAGRWVACILPSKTDPAIRSFDFPNYVLVNDKTSPRADLLVFLPGTNGKPPGPLAFLKAAADHGYRVISLAYNDTPAVAVYCPRRPDPGCSAQFRQRRIYGDGPPLEPAIDNTRAESIINRLVKLLIYLEQREPGRGWAQYLKDGAPNWSRIVLAGQSQGAGMAAFIAKQHVVARVILFSSPWDFYVSKGNGRRLAPWIATPSKTPPERWYGGYHERENMAKLLAPAYAELGIPPDHIRVFKRELPAGKRSKTNKNPYHGEGLFDPIYAKQRAFFLGRSL